MKSKIFLLRLRFSVVSFLAVLTSHPKLIRHRIMIGTLLIGLIALPSCHSKKKTMCYYFLLPDKDSAEQAIVHSEKRSVAPAVDEPLVSKEEVVSTP